MNVEKLRQKLTVILRFSICNNVLLHLHYIIFVQIVLKVVALVPIFELILL